MLLLLLFLLLLHNLPINAYKNGGFFSVLLLNTIFKYWLIKQLVQELERVVQNAYTFFKSLLLLLLLLLLLYIRLRSHSYRKTLDGFIIASPVVNLILNMFWSQVKRSKNAIDFTASYPPDVVQLFWREWQEYEIHAAPDT